MLNIIITAGMTLLICLAFMLIILRLRRKTEESREKQLRNEIAEWKQLLDEESDRKEQLNAQRESLEKEVLTISAKLQSTVTQKDDFKKHDKIMRDRFENLAQKILDEKTEKFDLSHKEGIKSLLEPLKERIKHFEQRVEDTNKEQISRHSMLREQLASLKQLNMKMTEEASNLTRALKGDTRSQGSWGEIVLESILQKSGLEKGREYYVQESHTTEEGRKRPDVIILLPDNKRMVIDSKVSLTAYERIVNADTEGLRESAMKDHLISVQRHIKELSNKRYHELYNMESPDFVLMFIPIETAYALALREENQLYAKAFDRNVVIVTPTTLLVALKTVETLWQHEKQNRNAIHIAEEAGKMYNKFVSFTESLEKLGDRIRLTQEAYDQARKQLVLGRGNLVSRAQNMKKLGAKASKELGEQWTQEERTLLQNGDPSED